MEKLDDQLEISLDNLDQLVEQNMAFLIRAVSGITGRYVHTEGDDEFSVALSAFAEAVERYDPGRGQFLSFAGLVIRSRLRTYLSRERKRPDTLSLEAMAEAGQEPSAPQEPGGEDDLREEVRTFRKELALFNLTLEQLADEAPRHRDTRERAISMAHRSSQDRDIVDQTYRRRHLPVRAVARLCGATEKIVKGSRHFILAAMLIFVKELPILLGWVRNAGCDHAS